MWEGKLAKQNNYICVWDSCLISILTKKIWEKTKVGKCGVLYMECVDVGEEEGD